MNTTNDATATTTGPTFHVHFARHCDGLTRPRLVAVAEDLVKMHGGIDGKYFGCEVQLIRLGSASLPAGTPATRAGVEALAMREFGHCDIGGGRATSAEAIGSFHLEAVAGEVAVAVVNWDSAGGPLTPDAIAAKITRHRLDVIAAMQLLKVPTAMPDNSAAKAGGGGEELPK